MGGGGGGCKGGGYSIPCNLLCVYTVQQEIVHAFSCLSLCSNLDYIMGVDP